VTGLTLKEVAELVQGRLLGENGAESIRIVGVGAIEEARPDQIAALDDERFLAAARASKAAAVLAPPKLAEKLERTRIVVAFPQIAQNRVIDQLGLWTLPWQEAGRAPSAQVDRTAEIGEGVAIGAGAVVGARARLGAGTRLYPHAIVEPGATIGARCRIHANAVIGAPATLGDECVIGHGAVIAGEGFGFGFGPTGPVRLRHLGRVILGNRVEVGNHSTIDRARFGDTRIGDDVKIDSQVHLGHNVVVGARTILAALCGVAGSSEIGENCLIGGQVGIADHVKIPSNTRIGAKSGIASTLEEPGDYFGFWAKEKRIAFRELAAMAKLPELMKELEQLKRELEEQRAKSRPAGESS
jgi:UDP-3-O-[3-hydroxymyristoyl] glucosamine N-acyltransferase